MINCGLIINTASWFLVVGLWLCNATHHQTSSTLHGFVHW